jgi:hypothetical protein
MVLSQGWTEGRRIINENPDEVHHEVRSSWKNDYMVLWLLAWSGVQICLQMSQLRILQNSKKHCVL